MCPAGTVGRTTPRARAGSGVRGGDRRAVAPAPRPSHGTTSPNAPARAVTPLPAALDELPIAVDLRPRRQRHGHDPPHDVRHRFLPLDRPGPQPHARRTSATREPAGMTTTSSDPSVASAAPIPEPPPNASPPRHGGGAIDHEGEPHVARRYTRSRVRPHRPHRGRGRRPRVGDRAPHPRLWHAARAPRDDRGAGRRGRAARRRREPCGAAHAALREDTPVGRFLAARGPGLHHVAYQVADVERRAAARRARPGCG